jgi:hypothetical protein
LGSCDFVLSAHAPFAFAAACVPDSQLSDDHLLSAHDLEGADVLYRVGVADRGCVEVRHAVDFAVETLSVTRVACVVYIRFAGLALCI